MRRSQMTPFLYGLYLDQNKRTKIMCIVVARYSNPQIMQTPDGKMYWFDKHHRFVSRNINDISYDSCHVAQMTTITFSIKGKYCRADGPADISVSDPIHSYELRFFRKSSLIYSTGRHAGIYFRNIYVTKVSSPFPFDWSDPYWIDNGGICNTIYRKDVPDVIGQY